MASKLQGSAFDAVCPYQFISGEHPLGNPQSPSISHVVGCEYVVVCFLDITNGCKVPQDTT